jgi:molecular chaperone GrpE
MGAADRENGSGEPIRIAIDPDDGGGGTAAPVDGVAALRDRWLRAEAELENLRKRRPREIEEARRQERRIALNSMLDALDTMERAMESGAGEENVWMEGFRATHQQLLDVVKMLGAEPFEAVGERFDPRRHEAVLTMPARGADEETVIGVERKGYVMGDGTVLRPARVVVAMGQEAVHGG